MKIPKIYLAGPDVFHENARHIGHKNTELCEKYGAIALNPLDNTPPTHDAARVIFAANRAMILQSDIVIANINPYMGAFADTGTVWEIGYAYGMGKLVYGYQDTHIDPDLNARVSRCVHLVNLEGVLRDSRGFCVDNLSLRENTMIVESLSGPIQCDFESCVVVAVEKFRNKWGY